MENLYRVKTTHDENSFLALAEIQSVLYESYRVRGLTVTGYVLIIAGGVLFALLEQSVIAFLPVMIGCWLLVSQGTLAKTRAKQMIKSTKGRDLSVDYRFETDGFCINNAQQKGKAMYDSIVNIAENEAYYFLFINNSTAHVLRKTDFTLGDPASFAVFIESRTGLKMKFHQRKKEILFNRRRIDE